MTTSSTPVLIDNRYELMSRLGGGGFGDVYEAWDRHQEVTVAIKLLRQTPGAGPWLEAQMMETLSGDFILPVRNADQDAGQAYIVTKLATHGAIGAKIGIGLDAPRAIQWTKQAAAGVQRCHDHGLIHRDLKPDNLFLDGDGRALVGDFGLAWALARGGAPTAGTPAYMPPDVAALEPMHRHSDLYGLGACLYAMLAGRPPLDNVPVHEPGHVQLAYVANTTPDSIRELTPHVPSAVHRLVEKAMAPDPADRFERAVDMGAALGALDHPRRIWSRTVSHSGHFACWSGEGRGLAALRVCVTSSGSRFDIETTTVASARRKVAQCHVGVARSHLGTRLRGVFGALSR